MFTPTSAPRVLSTLSLAAGLFLAAPAWASSDEGSPAEQAVEELRKEHHVRDIVQNRFFLKANRFEIAPVFGYVPNNPFAKRYVGGVLLAYHLSESFAAEGALLYSPDMGTNDLKNLTITLVDIAANSASATGDFQQPVDKLTLGATFAVRYAPVYGKINLLGEQVLNFDFYGTLGIGMLSMTDYYATYNEDYDSADPDSSPVVLNEYENDPNFPVNIGIGFDFFLNQTLALKIDARSYLYVDNEPQYDPDSSEDPGQRLYNNFIATAGICIFIPKMRPRITDF